MADLVADWMAGGGGVCCWCEGTLTVSGPGLPDNSFIMQLH